MHGHFHGLPVVAREIGVGVGGQKAHALLHAAPELQLLVSRQVAHGHHAHLERYAGGRGEVVVGDVGHHGGLVDERFQAVDEVFLHAVGVRLHEEHHVEALGRFAEQVDDLVLADVLYLGLVKLLALDHHVAVAEVLDVVGLLGQHGVVLLDERQHALVEAAPLGILAEIDRRHASERMRARLAEGEAIVCAGEIDHLRGIRPAALDGPVVAVEPAHEEQRALQHGVVVHHEGGQRRYRD